MAYPTLPPLDVLGPEGDRITLRAVDREDTVGGLADRLGADRLWTTGRALRPSERLADVDELRIGARLRTDPDRSPNSPERDSQTVVEVAVVAGPAASNWAALPAGRHLVGRAAHARIHLDDPGVEAHHALLLVSADGTLDVVQLSGAVPIRIEGRALEPGTPIGFDDRVTVGSSTLRFRGVRTASEPVPSDAAHSIGSGLVRGTNEPSGTIAAHPTDPWRRIVWRAPHRTPTWAPRPVVAPVAEKEPARPALTGLIGVAVTAAGAVVIAQVMGNVMFMLFAGMGVVASLTTFAVGTVTARRKRSKLRREHAEQVATFRTAVDRLHAARRLHHRSVHRSIVETHDEALGAGTRIWQRRLEPGDDAALCAVIGTGTHRWRPEIDVRDPATLDPSILQRVEASTRLVGVEAPVSIRRGDAIALHGPDALARSIARAVIVQLATWIGPADWQLVVVSSDVRSWRWVDWLPHGALDGSALVTIVGADLDGLGDALDAVDPQRTTLLVTDEPQLFTARTGALRRFVSASGAASIVVVDTDATVPAMCRRVLTVGSTGSASWTGDVPDDDDTVAIEFAGVSLDTADEIARRLACLVDPEDDGGSGGGVPSTVT
ncbi:MAG: hypothetical protein WA964_15490, partial [Ilumatobacter sp.]|uniref:hypothetical protein n=1 Tax=Ilumatobacter sp. TaxID=1967498 RepID=UPI003C707AB5